MRAGRWLRRRSPRAWLVVSDETSGLAAKVKGGLLCRGNVGQRSPERPLAASPPPGARLARQRGFAEEAGCAVLGRCGSDGYSGLQAAAVVAAGGDRLRGCRPTVLRLSQPRRRAGRQARAPV